MGGLINFDCVSLGYGRTSVLKDVSFEVALGDFVGIVGPNGSGKTTLLKAVLGLIRPQAGSIQVPRTEHSIGYVPQRDTLDTIYPLTVLDIVLMGLYDKLSAIGRPTRAHRQRAMEALGHTGIRELSDRSYGNLSGGQKQRAIIARALVSSPEVLLLDEPTNGMDLPGEEGIMALIQHLHEEHGMTVLLVSHLLHTVINHAKRIAFVAGSTVTVVDRDEVVGTSRLAEVYGMPVSVRRIDGRYVVLPGAIRFEEGLQAHEGAAQ